MKKIFLNNVGDLSEAPRASYIRFLLKGISEELFYLPIFLYTKELNKKFSFNKKSKPYQYINYDFVDSKDQNTLKKKYNIIKILLYKNEIKFRSTGINVNIAYLEKKSYCINLYIRGKKLLDKISEINKVVFIETYFLLGEIPLLTKEGTFIINGCERIMVNQTIKSPGIYFKELIINKKNKASHAAIIVSKDSKYTKILYETDKIYISINNFSSFLPYDLIGKQKCDSNKLYLFDIINYFQENNCKNIPNFKYPEQLISQRLTQEYDNNDKPLSLKGKIKISNTMRNIIEEIYLTKDSHFSIGSLGRYNLNKKLALKLSRAIINLTHLDFIRIMEMLIELRDFGKSIDDIDHLKEKQIRTLGKFFQIYLKETIAPIIKKFLYVKKEKIIKFKKLIFNIKNSGIFKINALTNYFSNENISFILYKKSKILNFKKNNFLYLSSFIKDRTNFDISSLRNSKIMKTFKSSFITNSLSQYMDQTNPLAELTHKRRISILGLSGLNKDCIPKRIRDIHPSRHGKICIIETPEGKKAGTVTSIAMYARIDLYGSFETPYFLIKNSIVLKNKKPIYLNSFEDSSMSISFTDLSLNKLNLINKKYLSVKENYSFNIKKTNLVKLLTTSQMQIISLGSSLVPFIEHNDASRALMGSNMQRQAAPLLLSETPLIGTNLEITASADTGMTIKNYSEGITLYSNSKKILIKDKNGFIISYNLKKYKRSNQNTSYNQKACIWVGEVVFSNQVIGDGPSTCNGELSLGKNLVLAYMPWEGYNFEDAILINEKLAYENILTSINIKEQNLILKESNLIFDILSNKSPYHTRYLKRHLNERGISRIGSYVYGKDILIGKLSKIFNYQSTSDENMLESVFGFSADAKFKDTSLHSPANLEGRVIGIKIFNITNKKLKVTSYNFKSKTIAKKFRIFLGIIRKISTGDKLSGRHGNKGIISKIMKQQDMPYLLDGTPIDIILNPLGVPSRMNIGQIFECLLGLASNNLKTRIKVIPFDEIYGLESSRILVYQKLKESALRSKKNWLFNNLIPGKTYVRDGRTSIFFDNPITVGKSYILKLIHIVEEKIYSRNTGSYSKLTSQPLGGKKLKGGQRFGEMETWALEAHGCSYILKELLNLKSDDINGRFDAYNAIALDNKRTMGSISEIFLLLIKELNSIGLYFSAFSIKNGFYATSNIKIKEKNFLKLVEKRLNLQETLKKNI